MPKYELLNKDGEVVGETTDAQFMARTALTARPEWYWRQCEPPALTTDPLQSFDARDWAREFMRLLNDGTFTKNREPGETIINEGLMLGWFANALMRGYDEHARKALTTEHERAVLEAMRNTSETALAIGVAHAACEAELARRAAERESKP